LLIYYFRKEEAEGHVSRKDKSDPKKKKKVKSQTLCGFKNLLIVQYLRALPLQKKKKHAINVVC
jgi:hypothetical protein